MKKHPPIYHFLFWLLAYTGWIFVFGNNALALTRTVTIQFCYLLFIASNYYFNTIFYFSTLLDKKKIYRIRNPVYPGYCYNGCHPGTFIFLSYDLSVRNQIPTF